MSHARPRFLRRGFTLVEILVVIAIIGVIVALLVPVLAKVMRDTRSNTIAIELNELSRAMEAYKSAANDFPPDFTNGPALVAHITKAFPRNVRPVAVWMNTVPTAPIPNPLDLDPAEALVFWLSLLSNNPRDPLLGADPTYAGERKSYFTFDATRLVDLDNDGWFEYVPRHATEAPYVYFDGRLIGGRYAYASAVYTIPKQTTIQPAPITGVPWVVRPYRSNILVVPLRDHGRTFPFDTPAPLNRTEWMKPGQFQIISAGLDNDFGEDSFLGNDVVFKMFPTPNYTMVGPDEDNLTSFSEMKTLGDSVP